MTNSTVTIIKEGLTAKGKSVAVGATLEVSEARKDWLTKRGFIAADTTTSSKSKTSSTSTTTTEEAK